MVLIFSLLSPVYFCLYALRNLTLFSNSYIGCNVCCGVCGKYLCVSVCERITVCVYVSSCVWVCGGPCMCMGVCV